MASEAGQSPRTLTEDEAYAIVADRVQRETAALTKQLDDLKRENAELSSKLDVSEAAVATEKAARETAEKALTDYKADVENTAAVNQRRTSREAKVREVAAHLKDEFFTDARRDRWAAMDDAAFEAHLGELADLSRGLTPTTTGAPRTTAMRGADAKAISGSGNARRLFELGRKGA